MAEISAVELDLWTRLENAASWAEAMHDLWESRGRTEDFLQHARLLQEAAREGRRLTDNLKSDSSAIDELQAFRDAHPGTWQHWQAGM
jgi:hypothetical protein